MISTKQIEKMIKRRSKSQRLKKSFQVMLRSDQKSDRKNSSCVKESFSYNNIKVKKEKQPKVKAETTNKTKSKVVKAKGKDYVSTNSLIEDHHNSVSQDIRTTVVYKDQIQIKDEKIKEQQNLISQLQQQLKFLNHKLRRIQERQENSGNQEQVVSRKSSLKRVKKQKQLKTQLKMDNHQKEEEKQFQNPFEVQSLLAKISDLESEALSQNLIKRQLLDYIQQLKKAHKLGVTSIVHQIKKVFSKKVKKALQGSNDRINEVIKQYRMSNFEVFEEMLKGLPGTIEKEFEKEIGK